MAKFRADKGTVDTDRDGLSDDFERNVLGTDPRKSDTDGDGMSDLREKDFATNPTERDTDRDGLSDLREVQIGTNPHRADTDSDGVGDLQEVRLGTASAPDEDSDGVPDWVDAAESDWDSDRDGLTDAEEHWLRTDPFRPNSDGDMIGDNDEVMQGRDPRGPFSPDGRPVIQVPNGPQGPVTPPEIRVPDGPNTDDATRQLDVPNGTLVNAETTGDMNADGDVYAALDADAGYAEGYEDATYEDASDTGTDELAATDSYGDSYDDSYGDSYAQAGDEAYGEVTDDAYEGMTSDAGSEFFA